MVSSLSWIRCLVFTSSRKAPSPAGCVVVILTIPSPWWLPERTRLYSKSSPAGWGGCQPCPGHKCFVTVFGCSVPCKSSRSHPGVSAPPVRRDLSGGQVADEISSESKFSRPPLVELKPSKDILLVSGSSRAYLALWLTHCLLHCTRKLRHLGLCYCCCRYHCITVEDIIHICDVIT